MAVFIATNTIKPVKTQRAVNRAVSEAIGGREGTWNVSITEAPDQTAWNVTIKGPNGFRWEHDFGGKRRTASRVGAAIRATLEASEEELATALAELATEGLIFTTEVRPDGKIEYVIDRIRLSGDDVRYLKSRGALTRHGIEEYLVDRR